MSLFFCHNDETDFELKDSDVPIILYTRDISHGRGRRDLTYAMIVCLYRSNPDLAMDVLRLCASKYGAWCDIKYFCRYVSECVLLDDDKRDIMIDGAIDILIHQIKIDYRTWTEALTKHLDNIRTISRPIGRDILSYAAKWVPREKSSMGSLFDRIVERWANKDHYNSRYKREFRKIISELNREIGTVEIKQCFGDIHNIMYEQIPIRALVNQYRTFVNLEVYPKNTMMSLGCRSFENVCRNLVRIALSMDDGKYDDMLNHIWSNNRANYTSHDIIPIVDVSTGCGGWFHAIGLGILIAQNSSHGHLILSEHDAHSIPAGRKDSFTSIIARIRPFLSGVTDSRLDLAIDKVAYETETVPMASRSRVVILSQNGNRHTQTFCSPIFYWFFGTKSEQFDCDSTYCDSMYMLSHYANGGNTHDYISTVLTSDRYNNMN